ncbi:MAG: SRPBCC family protein [Proteobacteria bacterium]|nr:SRPBCC family protein [Pseudomonadota bacterium]MCH8096437.1 SRPBCC family protein [Pseudomonadota bacterium]
MAQVSLSQELQASAEEVWELIGGFNSLPTWHPAVEKSKIEGEGEGQVRTLDLTGGATIRERLDRTDEDARSYTYSILSGPLPVADYVATLSVREAGDGACVVEWSSEFNPDGLPEAAAVEIIESVYQAGFVGLTEKFGE